MRIIVKADVMMVHVNDAPSNLSTNCRIASKILPNKFSFATTSVWFVVIFNDFKYESKIVLFFETAGRYSLLNNFTQKSFLTKRFRIIMFLNAWIIFTNIYLLSIAVYQNLYFLARTYSGAGTMGDVQPNSFKTCGSLVNSRYANEAVHRWLR